jgi:hypothetical protein
VTLTGLQLGPPGVYHVQRAREPELGRIRLDVAGFAGVAPRGPIDRPVVVESWSDFRWSFGGTEGPGMLAYAVRAFFAQGGRRAVICRVSPLPRTPDRVALAARTRHRIRLATPNAAGDPIPVELDLTARDEGRWGDRLVIDCSFAAGDRFPGEVNGLEVDLPAGTSPVVGTTLRFRGTGLPAPGVFRGVVARSHRNDPFGRRRPVAVLDRAPREATGPVRYDDIAVITLTVRITDSDPLFSRQETFGDLGLRLGHPRTVCAELAESSRLVKPAGQWPEVVLPPSGYLTDPVRSELADHGADRWDSIGFRSMFTDLPAELLPKQASGDEKKQETQTIFGADALALVPEVSLLHVPDLMWSGATETPTTETSMPTPGPTFGPCRTEAVTVTATPPVGSQQLDARTELEEVLQRQRRLVALADHQQRFVALLDVPENLSRQAIARWRAQFNSSYAAAYHPWLRVAADPPGSPAVNVPPGGFAAGIIAERERRLGIPWGPANALAADAVALSTAIDDAQHAALHAIDIDVFRAEQDGFRLTSAHTMSSDPQYRQLSVRRLMTMLRLVLDRQTQWLAFEPNTAQLRAQVGRTVTTLLRDLFRSGAFIGRTEEEAFYVRCDDTLNPAYSLGAGRLVAEVGVAPASPLEYLVLRIAQDAEGLLTVQG